MPKMRYQIIRNNIQISETHIYQVLPLCHLYYCSISGTVIEWTCLEILTIKSLHKNEVKYHINKRLLIDEQQIEQ